ncbi:phosphonate ABC transporter ATP-binding protein [Luteococcus sp. OSA5]|uniref:phosphonate ABC transporter ATP-binding protein n=1 Tax=Luteococcus sp. OSA5 TaxID=3401630 RepID=UPI003B427F37
MTSQPRTRPQNQTNTQGRAHTSEGASLLTVRSMTKAFGGRKVLEGIDFDVRAGELVAFLGANGSGKSTTLRCVMGLTEPDEGMVLLGGQNLSELKGHQRQAARHQAAMVFQKIHLVPRRTALQNVCAGALARMGTAQSLSPAFYPREIKEEAMGCLERVGLADRAHDRAGSLSGGQQQRVAVARALCQRAKVLLADEPVSALDPRAAEQVMHLLRDLAHSENLAVAAVLHQPDLARRHADRAIGLVQGRMLFNHPAHELSEDDLDLLYLPDRAPADAHHLMEKTA